MTGCYELNSHSDVEFPNSNGPIPNHVTIERRVTFSCGSNSLLCKNDTSLIANDDVHIVTISRFCASNRIFAFPHWQVRSRTNAGRLAGPRMRLSLWSSALVFAQYVMADGLPVLAVAAVWLGTMCQAIIRLKQNFKLALRVPQCQWHLASSCTAAQRTSERDRAQFAGSTASPSTTAICLTMQRDLGAEAALRCAAHAAGSRYY